MKRYTTLILVLVALAIGNKIFAQGLYFKAVAGYGLPIAPTIIGKQSTRLQDQTGNNNTIVTTSKNTGVSFSSGISGVFGVGYMFNQYLGAEVNIQYVATKKFETNNIYLYNSDNTNGTQSDITKYFSRALFVNPSFLVSPGGKLPYARFGVVLGSPTIKTEKSYYYNLDGKDSSTQKVAYKTNMALGFQGALGKKWTLGNHLSIFTEVSVISMTAYTKSAKMTEYIYDNQDQLPGMQTYYKETTYEKKLVENNLQSTDYDQPQKALREARACSSITLHVGIVYTLAKLNID